MANKFDSRQLISQNFEILRTLYDPVINDESIELSKKLNFVKEKANKVNINDLIESKIIDNNLVINPDSAYFLGISITKDLYSISLVGLDGIPVKSKKFLACLKKLPDKSIFSSYLYDELYQFLGYIKSLICDLKTLYQIKAVCFSFDDVSFDGVNKNAYSFTNFYRYPSMLVDSVSSIKSFLKGIGDEIEVYLECNSACCLIYREFNYIKKDLDVIYIDISSTGCYVSKMINNKIHYGCNFKSLNVTNLLSQSEINQLQKSNLSPEIIISILKEIAPTFAISLSPNYFLIGGTILAGKGNIASLINEHRVEIICEFKMQKDYLPDFEVDIEQDVSIGTAISAMYQYYGWEYNC